MGKDNHPRRSVQAVIAGLASCLLALPAGAGEIMVNGGLSGVGPFPEQYGPYITTDQPSLSGSVADGGGGFASSSGNLATGELKIFNQSAPGYGASVGSTTVTLRDTIHVTGDIPFPVTATLTAGLEGTLVPSTWYETEVCAGCASAAAFFQLQVDGATGDFIQYVFQTTGCPASGEIGGQSCVNTTSFDTQVSMSFTISDSKRDFDVYAYLGSSTFAGGMADVSHTASLQLTLPEALGFTSDSGVFLTAVAAVPEPGTWMMLGAGLAGLLVQARRRGWRSA